MGNAPPSAPSPSERALLQAAAAGSCRRAADAIEAADVLLVCIGDGLAASVALRDVGGASLHHTPPPLDDDGEHAAPAETLDGAKADDGAPADEEPPSGGVGQVAGDDDARPEGGGVDDAVITWDSRLAKAKRYTRAVIGIVSRISQVGCIQRELFKR